MRCPRFIAALLALLIGTAAAAQTNGPAPAENDVRFSFAGNGEATAARAYVTPLVTERPRDDQWFLSVVRVRDDRASDALDTLHDRVGRNHAAADFDLAFELSTPLLLDIRIAGTTRFAPRTAPYVDGPLDDRVGNAVWLESDETRDDATTRGRRAASAHGATPDIRFTANGLAWRVDDVWHLRTRFGYGPTRDVDQLAVVPAAEQYRFSVGIQHDLGGGRVIGASYTLLYAPIDDLTPSSGSIANGGLDPSLVHVFGLTFGLEF